ncbi:MAG: hypothetical protein KC656_04435 [Myxococcales bacterium]|nr:hypothetical protein [Myxococcales bacterium]
MSRGVFGLAGAVLRDPIGVVEAHQDAESLREVVVPLLGIAAVGCGIFGVVVGGYRGGLQVPFAALKMPALLWIPVILTLPACRAFFAAAEIEVSWNRMTIAGLVAMARTAVLAAAIGPVVWLVYSLQPSYHLAVLLLAATLGLVGLPGLSVLARSMPTGGRNRWMAALASVVVLAICTAQTGWVLRPFVARPAAEVTFLRPLEEDVFSSLGATTRSATGDYSKDWQPERKGMFGGRGR